MSQLPLHPELANLYERYMATYRQWEAQQLTTDQAQDAIAHLATFDATGAMWGMNMHGQFVRAWPGAQPEVADPTQFAPPTLPLDPGGYLLEAPVGIGPSPKQLKLRRLKATGAAGAGAAARGLSGVFARLNITPQFAVVAVSVALFLAFVLITRDAPDTTSDIPTGAIGVPAERDRTTDPDAVEDDTDPDGTPTVSAISDLLTLASSGQTELIDTAIAEAFDGSTYKLEAARLAGWRLVGLELRVIGIIADADDHIADLELVDPDAEEILATGSVRILRDGDRWQLSSWPQLRIDR
jgi:hypothetical protein